MIDIHELYFLFHSGAGLLLTIFTSLMDCCMMLVNFEIHINNIFIFSPLFMTLVLHSYQISKYFTLTMAALARPRRAMCMLFLNNLLAHIVDLANAFRNDTPKIDLTVRSSQIY